MNKFMSILLVMVILAMAGTALAEYGQDPCRFFKSQTKDELQQAFYINPREVSHLQAVYDNSSTAVGSSGRYILGVIMTNGDVIRYGTYQTYDLRRNVANDIIKNVIKCNAE